MKLLADESVDRAFIEFLRALHQDVTSIFELDRGAPDEQVLSRANAESRILITCDRDFGELIYQKHWSASGILLLRFTPPSGKDRLEMFRLIWPLVEQKLPGAFVVAKDHHIRTRQLPSQ